MNSLSDNDLRRIELALKWWRAEDAHEMGNQYLILVNMQGGEDSIAKKFAQATLDDSQCQYFQCLVRTETPATISTIAQQ